MTRGSSFIDLGLGIVAASLTGMRPLFGMERWKMISSMLSGTTLGIRNSKCGTGGTAGSKNRQGIQVDKSVRVESAREKASQGSMSVDADQGSQNRRRSYLKNNGFCRISKGRVAYMFLSLTRFQNLFAIFHLLDSFGF